MEPEGEGLRLENQASDRTLADDQDWLQRLSQHETKSKEVHGDVAQTEQNEVHEIQKVHCTT